MIYMFFGDSHSRQFVGTSFGTFCHYVFSGATIKGLANNKSKTGHASLIKSALTVDVRKTLFFMFGSVDLDFSRIRAHCLGDVDTEQFMNERIAIYSDFVASIKNDFANIENIFVIAPQISPLVGENFFVQTAKHISLDEGLIREAARKVAIGDVDRAKYIIHFNDHLEKALEERAGVKLLRIDRAMVDEQGAVKPNFIPADPNEHHARLDQTQRAWKGLVGAQITEHNMVG